MRRMSSSFRRPSAASRSPLIFASPPRLLRRRRTTTADWSLCRPAFDLIFTWSRTHENANLMNKMGDLRWTKTKRASYAAYDSVGTAKSPQSLFVRAKRSKNRGSALKCVQNQLTPLTDCTAFRWLCELTLIFHRNFARRRCFCEIFIFAKARSF